MVKIVAVFPDLRTMEETADLELDPQLPRCDLHSLRARDGALDLFAHEVQQSAARCAAEQLPSDVVAAMRNVLGGKAVLITGSAGYLGATLHIALKQYLDIPVVGVDIVPGDQLMGTVDVVADVSNLEAIQQIASGSGAVLHTAALHAPHASFKHENDYIATNVHGTEVLLSLDLPMVHTSTTSLTITPRVKARERAGDLVWLNEGAQRETGGEEGYDAKALDAPRNKYGRTKLAAEQLCSAAALRGQAVCILRAPRFFPEDILEDNPEQMPLANIKANELLGRRCSLLDLVDAELRALARVGELGGRVLTIAAPWWPVERINPVVYSAKDAAALVRELWPDAEALFAERGWRLPAIITRVYDGSAAVDALDWNPCVTFDALVRALATTSKQVGEANCVTENPPLRLRVETALTGAY